MYAMQTTFFSMKMSDLKYSLFICGYNIGIYVVNHHAKVRPVHTTQPKYHALYTGNGFSMKHETTSRYNERNRKLSAVKETWQWQLQGGHEISVFKLKKWSGIYFYIDAG
jgi:hypothetical protein